MADKREAKREAQAVSPTERAPGLPAPLCSPDCASVFEPVNLPLWMESEWVLSWLALRFTPVYYGRVQARGHDGPVIVVPGFLHSDLYLAELHLWLARVGYRPILSDIGRNADCPDVLLERLIETIDDAHGWTGRRVKLIGHSFGGVIARGAAVRRPDRVSQVITLASPFRALRAHRFVLEAVRVLGRLLPPPYLRPRVHKGHAHASQCSCEFLGDQTADWPASVRRIAVYTKSDGVVDWRACMEDDPTLNVEVHGSHAGLVFNPEVYQLLARLLAEGEEKEAGRER